jgi:hypothetical protein
MTLLFNRVGQIEVAATFVEASRGRSVALFGLPYAEAPEMGFMRVAQKGDPIFNQGACIVAALPVDWGLVSVSCVLAAGPLPAGDIVLQTSPLNGGGLSAPQVIEDPSENANADGAYEVLVIPSLEPIQYAEDMAAVPIAWGRLADHEDDTNPDDLMVVGHTFRPVE